MVLHAPQSILSFFRPNGLNRFFLVEALDIWLKESASPESTESVSFQEVEVLPLAVLGEMVMAEVSWPGGIRARVMRGCEEKAATRRQRNSSASQRVLPLSTFCIFHDLA